MAKQMCDLCQQHPVSDMVYGVSLCENCMGGYDQAMNGDPAAIAYFSNPQNFPMATELAQIRIVGHVAKRNAPPQQPVYYANPQQPGYYPGPQQAGYFPNPPQPVNIPVQQPQATPEAKIYHLLQEQTRMIRTIKNCVVFFTVLCILALVIAFLGMLAS